MGSELNRNRAIAAAITFAPVIHIIVVTLLRVTNTMPPNGFVGLAPAIEGPVGAGLVVLALVFALLGKKWPRLVLKGGALSELSPEARAALLIKRMTIAETGAVPGLVYVLLSGNLLWFSITQAIAAAACIQCFPTRADFPGDDEGQN